MKMYYMISLEVSLVSSVHVFGLINISHIPYQKFEEIFADQLQNDEFLFQNGPYILEEALYIKHKQYLDDNISFSFDFTLFEYAVDITSIDASKYVKDYYEELPKRFKRKNNKNST